MYNLFTLYILWKTVEITLIALVKFPFYYFSLLLNTMLQSVPLYLDVYHERNRSFCTYVIALVLQHLREREKGFFACCIFLIEQSVARTNWTIRSAIFRIKRVDCCSEIFYNPALKRMMEVFRIGELRYLRRGTD